MTRLSLSGIFLVILAIAYYKLAVELGLRMIGGGTVPEDEPVSFAGGGG